MYPQDAPDQALSFGAFFSALDLVVGPSYEVVVAGDPAAADTKAMLRELRRRFLPRVTVILRPTDTADPPITRIAPFTAAQTAIGGRATAYVCEAGCVPAAHHGHRVMLGAARRSVRGRTASSS